MVIIFNELKEIKNIFELEQEPFYLLLFNKSNYSIYL